MCVATARRWIGRAGIFTREGYRELFDKRLPEFVAAATANDGWVMGRESTPKKLTDSLRSQIPGQEQSVAREVRRLYLTEYARRWQDFLDSIHSINSAGKRAVPAWPMIYRCCAPWRRRTHR